MTDEGPPRPAGTGLTLDDVAYLGHLGADFRVAPGYRAAQAALDAALEAALRYREAGIGWAELTHALGVPREELLHRWNEVHSRPRPPVLPIAGPFSRVLPSLENLARERGTRAQVSSPLSESQNQAFTISESSAHQAVFSATLHADASLFGDDHGRTPPPTTTARRVLFLSGDQRPGRNDFGTEASYIRRALATSFVEVVEMGGVGLPEICAALDRHSPAVLHFAAHRSFDGVFLSEEDGGLCVRQEAFCEQIARARHPPRLAVLSFCDSYPMADTVAVTIPSVISWPCLIDDGQAQPFADQLYRSLASRRSIGESCEDAKAALYRRPPDGPPALHGSPGVQIF